MMFSSWAFYEAGATRAGAGVPFGTATGTEGAAWRISAAPQSLCAADVIRRPRVARTTPAMRWR